MYQTKGRNLLVVVKLSGRAGSPRMSSRLLSTWQASLMTSMIATGRMTSYLLLEIMGEHAPRKQKYPPKDAPPFMNSDVRRAIYKKENAL